MNNEEICGEKKKEKVHIIKSGNRGKDGERGEKIVVKWWRGLNGGGGAGAGNDGAGRR